MGDGEYGDARNRAVQTMLEDVHGFAIPLPPFRPQPGELLLAPSCAVEAGDPAFHGEAVAAVVEHAVLAAEQDAGTQGHQDYRHTPAVKPDRRQNNRDQQQRTDKDHPKSLAHNDSQS